ncbi:MAG: metallophosphoesterase [Propionibacteriaceae bacterium]|jgi:3',5'-cyclic AMP phosphodiesterase CpdA|nr:metallophosphoesterase [Propionibacteriaceae bacterium]
MEPAVQNNAKLRFAVISDTQLGDDSNGAVPEQLEEKLRSALTILRKDYFEVSGLDAIVVAGDLSQNGRVAEFEAFARIFREVFPESDFNLKGDVNPLATLKALYIKGNHDNYGDGSANYFNTLAPGGDYRGGDGNYLADVNGYKFVMLSQPSTINSGNLYDRASQAFVKAAMVQTAAADPGGDKPIFVVTHPHLYGTVYGSEPTDLENSDWATRDIKPYLDGYRQTIAFSGHSHYPISDERSIDQGEFTALGTGAIAYVDNERGYSESPDSARYVSKWKESVGYYVEVDSANTTTITRLDFARHQVIKEPWVVKPPSDPGWLRYSKGRDKGAPVFSADAKVELLELQPTSVRVRFEQATDAESDVHHYKLSINETSSGVEVLNRVFFSHYFNLAEMPKILTWGSDERDEGASADMDGELVPGTEYEVGVIAYDSFSNASEPLRASFITPPRSPELPSTDFG